MPFLRALAILICLVAMLLLLAKTGAEPVPVSLQWGSVSMATTAPVATTFALIILVVAFYIGRLAGWITQLPDYLRALAAGHRHQTTWETLTQGFTAVYLGNMAAAGKLAKRLKPGVSEAPLATLLKLQTNQLSAAEAEAFLVHPTLGPVVTLHFARNAAAAGNWGLVKHYTSAGLGITPSNPTLIVLHFKALLNLNDPTAVAFLPNLKPMLTRNTYQLLSTIIAAGITTPHAAALSHPWVRAFQKWLPTASEILPDEPKTPRG